eukprot:CAMPEP_0181514436 /NCGR_PEP_ID=MMETSP1110-20121109/63033_1 /TAXON_ID=174948 /ORGANISM="Symbiodinium sp., Strain CCMP421" /LENGTH=38 /DNA_ID= /DNA_START= /DNA_END= /DNA_ORIENTATION=
MFIGFDTLVHDILVYHGVPCVMQEGTVCGSARVMPDDV